MELHHTLTAISDALLYVQIRDLQPLDESLYWLRTFAKDGAPARLPLAEARFLHDMAMGCRCRCWADKRLLTRLTQRLVSEIENPKNLSPAPLAAGTKPALGRTRRVRPPSRRTRHVIDHLDRQAVGGRRGNRQPTQEVSRHRQRTARRQGRGPRQGYPGEGLGRTGGLHRLPFQDRGTFDEGPRLRRAYQARKGTREPSKDSRRTSKPPSSPVPPA